MQRILLRLMIYLAETEKKYIQILNINVREYFRYIKNEYQSMHDMSDIVESNADIYKTALEKLNNTKENLIKQKDISILELNHQDLENKNAFLKNKDLAFSKMLPRDTKRVQIFKGFYVAYLNSIISEYERLRFLNTKRHKDNIDIFLKKLSECIVEFHVSLADRQTEFGETKYNSQ